MPELNTQFPTWMLQKTWHDKAASSKIGDQTLQAMQLGAQMAQQSHSRKLQDHAHALEQQAKTHYVNGMMEMGDWMSKGAQVGYDNPEWQAGFWQRATKYPQLGESAQFKALTATIDNANKYRQQLDEILLRNQLDTKLPPADVQKTEYLTNWRQQLDAATASGDTAKASELQRSITLLEGTMLAPTETIETFTDDMGNQGVRVVRGGTTASGLTTAATTDLQKRMLNFENMSGMSKRLLEAIGPLDIGIAGWGQQVIVNEGLAQFFPGLASQSTTDARSLLGTFNESMIKALKADAQVNKQEEKRILSVLPKAGPNESLPSATAKIVRAMREIHSLSMPVYKRLGQPEPKFPLSADEIKALYKSGKLTDMNLLRELLNTYHPEALTPFK